MIPNPRTIHPRLSPKRHARAQRRVLWLMRGAGYLKREAGGLGAEPPPVEEEEEEEDEPEVRPEPEPEPAAEETNDVAPVILPSTDASPPSSGGTPGP
jgi:hypothetical protein